RLGRILLNIGKVDEAEPAARRAVELADKLGPYQQVNPCFIMAEFAALRGDAKLTQIAGQRGMQLMAKVFAPDTARFQKAKIRFGRALLDIGKIDEADALFGEVMQADAQRAAVYDSPWTSASILHARAQIARGQPSAAVPALDAALSKYLAQPANIRDLNEELDLRLSLGRALSMTDHAKEALPHLERALALRQPQFASSPLLAEAQLALADCKLRLGDAAAARTLLTRAKTIHAANRQLAERFRQPLRDLEQRLR
ncbi:MAG TPA: tetratricopeptide repeat protein, partial [Steroidobacteraceae bacterium]|nr:tetratricopeptide repeat protein [Steroidobacteraceae bacterium]